VILRVNIIIFLLENLLSSNFHICTIKNLRILRITTPHFFPFDLDSSCLLKKSEPNSRLERLLLAKQRYGPFTDRPAKHTWWYVTGGVVLDFLSCSYQMVPKARRRLVGGFDSSPLELLSLFGI
jgi:hypothetical protein